MNFLEKNPMLAYGLMALIVVLIIVVIYYYYSKSKKDSATTDEPYTAGIPPVKFPEMMTASYIPDSRSDREYLNGSGVRKTLQELGLPATKEPLQMRSSRPGGPLPYSTENALYRNLHAAAAMAERYK